MVRAHLVGELADAGAQDGLHAEVGHVAGVAGADVRQLQPQRVLGLGLQAAEQLVVAYVRQPARRLTPLLLLAVRVWQFSLGLTFVSRWQRLRNSSSLHTSASLLAASPHCSCATPNQDSELRAMHQECHLPTADSGQQELYDVHLALQPLLTCSQTIQKQVRTLVLPGFMESRLEMMTSHTKASARTFFFR